MTDSPIKTTRRGAVLEVTLDRPKANAIDATTSRIMGDVFTEFRDDPDLRGRLRLSGVFHPSQPGAASPTLSQAFVFTDIISASLLLLGQHIELQVTAATTTS